MNVWKIAILLIFNGLCGGVFAQHDNHDHPHNPDGSHPAQTEQRVNEAPGQNPAGEPAHPAAAAGHDDPCAPAHDDHHEEFDAGKNAVHHISDANVFHIFGDIYVPLPVIVKDEGGIHFLGLSNIFNIAPHSHGNGSVAVDRYVLRHGVVNRVADPNFPKGYLQVGNIYTKEEEHNGKPHEVGYVCYNNTPYRLEEKTTYDGGLVGGGVSSFSDYSITKNVFFMGLTFLLLCWLLSSVARAYRNRRGMAPKGVQGLLEPIFNFVIDDVAKPNIGPKYEKYVPYLLSTFFFILGLNLLGQIPFFPFSANVTGNISVTIVLALISFIITMASTNKHFWSHTLWMPGVPAVLKIFILTPIELLGVFLKPFTLLLRLFANVTAGHIVILSFVSLIFILGKSGTSMSGSIAGVIASGALSLFMMSLELLVAFLQAYIFTMLTASYIGAAVEEPHHH